MLATFAMGCFWHSQDVYRDVKGVLKTTVGYMGGKLKNPTYDDVCTNKTGHIEVVQVEYNPKIVSYDKLLDLFFNNHDYTAINKQGPDEGIQYASVIFYHNPKQKTIALKHMKSLKNIATVIRKTETFYKAEEYHQDYNLKHGGSCRL